MQNTTNTEHLVLNSDEEVWTVHIKDITYVDEHFDGPTELIIDVEKNFIEEVVVEDAANLSEVEEVRLNALQDVIYEDLQENYSEAVDFKIVSYN